ncbi:MAG: GAF domain-containing protein [Elusimicrobiota bacterium]
MRKLNLYLSFRFLLFLVILVLVLIFAYCIRNAGNSYLIFVAGGIVLIVGYIWIFQPLRLLEQLFVKSREGNYYDYQPKITGLGKFGADLELLFKRLLVFEGSLNILFAASKTITSRIEINEVIEMLLDLVYEKMMIPSTCVVFLDDDGFLRIKASRGLSDNFVKNMHPRPDEGFVGKAFSTKATIIVNDATKERHPVTEKLVDQEGLMSFVHIPIIVNDKAVGVFNVNSDIKSFFDANIVKTLTTLTDYLAIAISNSKMYQDIQEFNKRLELEVEATTEELTKTNLRLIAKVKEMKTLNDIIFSATGKVDMNEMFSTVAERLKLVTNVANAGFVIYDEQTKLLVGNCDFDTFNLAAETTDNMLSKSYRNATTFISNELFMENASDLQNLYKKYRITSLIALPLIEKKVLGLLLLGNKATGKFSQDDMRFLSVVASQIAELIVRIKLYEQLNHRLNDLMTLRDISNTIKTEPQLEETVEVLAEKSIRALESDYVLCWLLDEPSGALMLKFPPEMIPQHELQIPKTSTSIIAEIFQKGNIQYLDELELPDGPYQELQKTLQLKSHLFVPLKVEDKSIGLFCFCSKSQKFFNDEKSRLAELIAGQTAVIVENARIHNRLKEINIELERLNKIKDDFVSMVSHELRTPLTAIKGFVHVVLDEEAGKINDQQKKFLRIVEQSSNHLTRLISDLLDLSKIEKGLIILRIEKLNLSDVVKKSIETNINQIKHKNINIKLEIDKEIPNIDGDFSRLLQVYDNLVSNAVKFTPNGGDISIIVKNKGDFVLSAITDTGIGIPKEEHEKIFDKFYQIDSSYTRIATGTGLGLYIAKSIIELHGGNIWIDSAPAKGSTFSFLLPKIKKTDIIDKKKQEVENAQNTSDRR